MKIGLSAQDLVFLQKYSGKLVECNMYVFFHEDYDSSNNIDSLMQSGATGYFTTNLISYVGSLLNAPVTVSGYIQGLDKLVPTTSVDIESLRRYHPTVLFISLFECRTSTVVSICPLTSTQPFPTWRRTASTSSLPASSTFRSSTTSSCRAASPSD